MVSHFECFADLDLHIRDFDWIKFTTIEVSRRWIIQDRQRCTTDLSSVHSSQLPQIH